ncbi:hypothetical protein vBAbaMPhT2_252 [Acinetobacter phage vB_AbaM_PhT2]|uniref:Uncharacterized protein n=1 Tax=Acinetobacter phage vB_AbaM_PhT2 TaxID=2690230 RepID=A0A6B9SZF1_9CAUD|nr:hypothetical protein HYQ24_gp186 [Acinetobacter phage vB_AbaM_PhT2]QHJ75855.1 hypothetical protein vBAbaMPhT2_252 [Acinetobacter phage vB_AbaM_PhT2]SSU39361.1 Uncharacterised protein [Acinetobacter baumannii]
MNSLMCNHDFDFNSQLLSSPPKVRCRKCRITATLDDANEYKAFSTPMSPVTELEKKEFWKACALAYLPNSTIISGQTGITSSVSAIADNMVEHFVKRFG